MVKRLKEVNAKNFILVFGMIGIGFEIFESINDSPKSELKYRNAFELLCAVVLSAQATDKSVNKATGPLYEIADTPEKMVALGEEGLIPYIKSIGLYKSKARHVIGLCEKLISDFAGQVPRSREELMSLQGRILLLHQRGNRQTGK